MIKTEHTEVTEIHMTALPESKLGDCMRDAMLMACKEWQNVVLTYHDRKYQVLCNDLLGCVEEMQEGL